MKVVLDTNVLISAFLSSAGTAQYVLRAAIRKHECIFSEYILEEMRRKLALKLHFTENQITPMLSFLRKHSRVMEIKVNSQIHFKDKKDIPILSLLEAVRPQYFITGDIALQALKKFEMTLILNPREAMEIL